MKITMDGKSMVLKLLLTKMDSPAGVSSAVMTLEMMLLQARALLRGNGLEEGYLEAFRSMALTNDPATNQVVEAVIRATNPENVGRVSPMLSSPMATFPMSPSRPGSINNMVMMSPATGASFVGSAAGGLSLNQAGTWPISPVFGSPSLPPTTAVLSPVSPLPLPSFENLASSPRSTQTLNLPFRTPSAGNLGSMFSAPPTIQPVFASSVPVASYPSASPFPMGSSSRVPSQQLPPSNRIL